MYVQYIIVYIFKSGSTSRGCLRSIRGYSTLSLELARERVDYIHISTGISGLNGSVSITGCRGVNVAVGLGPGDSCSALGGGAHRVVGSSQ